MTTNPPPDGLLIQMSWKEAWPIGYPVWSEWHQCYGDAVSRSHEEKLLELANGRATKRLDERAWKVARARRYEDSRKIPGAWPI